MIKSVRVDKFAPSRKELAYSEFADIIQKSVEMSEAFHRNLKRTERQQELHDIIMESEIPEGEPLVILCYGVTGSGKSFGCLAEMIGLQLEYPGLKALFARRTYVEIEDSVWPATTEFLDKFDIPFTKRVGAREIELGNRSRIRMRSAEPAARSKTNKVHGLGSTEYGVAFLEEVDEIQEEFLYTVFARMRQKVTGFNRPVILLACNPPSKQHWLYEYFFEDPENNPYDPKSYKRVLKFERGDNESNVREGYGKGLAKVLKDDPLLLEAFEHGNFAPDKKGFPIFHKSFSEDLHVAKTSIHKSWNPDRPIFISVDFGFVGSAILCGQDYPELNQLRAYKSWHGKNELLRPFLNRVLPEIYEMFPGCRLECFCDPHGEAMNNQGVTDETAVKILKSMGLPPRYKYMSIERGLDVIQEAMTSWSPSKYGPVPGLLIDPQCELLIEALKMGYCNNKEAPKGKVDPVKDGVSDHQVDVLRYVMILKRRGDNRGAGLDPATDHGRWKTVAAGDPNTWATQMAIAKDSRIPMVTRNGRRRGVDRISPNYRRTSSW